MKNIQDYLHLYLGCECFVFDKRTILLGCHTNGNYQTAHAVGAGDYWHAENIKPILRPLSDMSEEEKTQIYAIGHMRFKGGIKEMLQFNQFDSYQFLWLLSKHFDLFGLIEAGLAIDKTKI